MLREVVLRIWGCYIIGIYVRTVKMDMCFHILHEYSVDRVFQVDFASNVVYT